jgi:hypothetical protein
MMKNTKKFQKLYIFQSFILLSLLVYDERRDDKTLGRFELWFQRLHLMFGGKEREKNYFSRLKSDRRKFFFYFEFRGIATQPQLSEVSSHI